MSVTYASISSLLAKPFQRLTSGMWNTAVLLLDQLYLTGGNVVTSILQNGNLYIPNSIFAQTGNFSDEVYVSGQPVITEADPIYIAGFISTAQQQIAQVLQSNEQLYDILTQIPYDIYTAVISSVPSATKSVSQSISSLNSLIYDIANYLISVENTNIIRLDKLVYDIALYFINNFNVQSINLQYIVNQVYYNIAKIVNQSTQGLYHGIVSISDLLLYALTYIYLAQVSLANTLNKLTLYLSPPTIEGLQLNVSTTPQPLYNGPALKILKMILQNLSNYVVYIGNNLYNNFPILPNSEIEIAVNNPANVYAWATGKCTIYALFEVIES
ncbi:hypothetical protein SBRV1_gp43 [Sulfolobales Beppu rod-shaped virus 1]|uniref:Uncharacterized protein n=1 Tax=Sulfolobales Beppu rod-shaped virus 1 TaxID=2493121 RepID=A0A3Q8Q9I3_9VIRU|nr:hypothetical protein QIT32_gp43 [Sulfolobales Beppu rod-shaped virus 1]AZI75932.1 hypothetical protein SBRV1_gp43 [Sulfolobales Beppu rod-shaped virus 1]